MLSESTPPLPQLNGVYFVKGLGLPNSTLRNLTLVLTGDGTAVLITEFVGKGTILERGSWLCKDKQAEILWTELDGETIALRMTFELRGNELIYVGPDPNALGALPVRLHRVSEASIVTVPPPAVALPHAVTSANAQPY